MPKLKNVTIEELKAAEERAFDLSQIVADLHQRVSQGYADEVPNPLALASSFASISRTIADLSGWFLMKASLQEQKRELEELHRKRT